MGASISITGDIALHGLFDTDRGSNRERFEDMTGEFNPEGIHIMNLEIPARGSGGINEQEQHAFTTSAEVLSEILTLLNVKIVSLANNHIYDGKSSGLAETISLLDKINILHTGAGFTEKHISPVIFNYDGERYGFLAYVHRNTNPGTENTGDIRINYYDRDTICREVQELKKKAGRIILSLHWGNDYSRYFTASQQADARMFADAGADVIMGHHPHVIQPFEKYNRSYIFYSLGQLCSGDFIWENRLRALKRKTKRGLIVHLDGNLEPRRITTTKELKGNRVITWPRHDFLKRNTRHYALNLLRNRSRAMRFLLNIRELIIDRVYEYFFGYYRNPVYQFVRLFSAGRKMKYVRRDFNTMSGE